MLWIQYEDQNCQIGSEFIQDITNNLAKLAAPYPVAVYNEDSDLKGLFYHDGCSDHSETESASRAENVENVGRYSTDLALATHFSQVQKRETTSKTSTLLDVQDISTFQQLGAETNKTDRSSNSNLKPAEALWIDASSVSIQTSKNNTQSNTAASPQTHGELQTNNSNSSAISSQANLNVSPTNSAPHGDGNEGGDDEDGEQRKLRPTDVPPDPVQKVKKLGIFTGVANVVVTNSAVQRLTISFGLQINPSYDADTDTMACRIYLDKFFISASRMEYTSSTETHGVIPDHYFVTEEAWISAGPSAGECTGPYDVHPRTRDFHDKLIQSTNWQGGAGLGASGGPSVQISYGKEKQRELPSISSEVMPISFGNGERQDFEWRYKTYSSSSETHVEFSEKNPPTHTVTYTIENQDPQETMSSSFRVRIRSVFRVRGKIIRGNQGRNNLLSSKLRYLLERRLRHLSMTLQADVGCDGLDHCRFPTPTKSGCKLSIGVDIRQALSGQTDQAVGAVRSKLDSIEWNRN